MKLTDNHHGSTRALKIVMILMLSMISSVMAASTNCAEQHDGRSVTVCESCEDGHGSQATFESTRLEPGSTYDGTDEIVKCLSTFNMTMIAEKSLVATPNTNYYVWVDNGEHTNHDYLKELQKKAVQRCLPHDSDSNTDIEVLSIHHYHALRPRDATWDGHNVHQHFGISEDCDCGMSQEGTYPLSVTNGSEAASDNSVFKRGYSSTITNERYYKGRNRIPGFTGTIGAVRAIAMTVYSYVSTKPGYSEDYKAQGFKCGVCYNLPWQISSRILIQNLEPGEVDVMVWPHHRCASESNSVGKKGKPKDPNYGPGKWILTAGGHSKNKDYRVGSFFIECKDGESPYNNPGPYNDWDYIDLIGEKAVGYGGGSGGIWGVNREQENAE